MRNPVAPASAALVCAAGLFVATAAVRLTGAPQVAQPDPQQIEFFEARDPAAAGRVVLRLSHRRREGRPAARFPRRAC